MYDIFVDLCQKNSANIADIVKETGLPYSLFTDWKKGRSAPKTDKLKIIADYFNVSLDYLVSGDESGTTVDIPIVGRIKAGMPSEAIEEVVDYIGIPRKQAKSADYIALQVSGDSMSPFVESGDIVLIKRTSEAVNGQIVAVLIDGSDATLKKIQFRENAVSLIPLNPSYPIINLKKTDNFEIIGHAVELRRML